MLVIFLIVDSFLVATVFYWHPSLSLVDLKVCHRNVWLFFEVFPIGACAVDRVSQNDFRVITMTFFIVFKSNTLVAPQADIG